MLRNSNKNQYQSCVQCQWTFILSLYLHKNLPQEFWARGKHFLFPGLSMVLYGTAMEQHYNPFYMVTSNKSFPDENHCSAAGADTLISNHRRCWGTEFILSSHKGVFQRKSSPDPYIRKMENLDQNHTSLANKWIQIFKPCKAKLQGMFTGGWIPA